MRKQVFISYRHENDGHARAVQHLGELLRQAGVPVALDQYLLDDRPGGPDEGWPKWCEDCANESECVLIVASEGWFAAYENKGGQGSGRGAATEAHLFRQALYDEKGRNARIRLAFLHDVAPDKVPARLRAWHQFRPLDTKDQLVQMVRWIGDCLGLEDVASPTVEWPQPVTFDPDLADRSKQEWPAIADLLAGKTSKRILLLEGGTGLGKSLLLRQAELYAKELGICVVYLDFKGGVTDVQGILDQLDLDLGENYLPSFSQAGATETRLLRKDLRGLPRPVLAIFDSYEQAAENDPVASWLAQQLLVEVETALGLAVIVAGQKVPDFADARWREFARHIPCGTHHGDRPLGRLGRPALPGLRQGAASPHHPGADGRQSRQRILLLRDHRRKGLIQR